MKRLVHESAKTVRLWLHIALLFLSFADTRAEVTFDWAIVGNPGNVPQVRFFFATDEQGGGILSAGEERDKSGVLNFTYVAPAGAVNYGYRISKHEVTNAQYAEFLNSVDPEGANSLGLYNTGLTEQDAAVGLTDRFGGMAGPFGGIHQDLSAEEGSRYVLRAGQELKPVNYVSWFDAARFTNWLENGQGSGLTETGVYDIAEISVNGLSGSERTATSDFFLPNRDEWRKSAYHDATAGTEGVYFHYANGSNILPPSAPPSDDPNGANYIGITRFFPQAQIDPELPLARESRYALTGSTEFPINANPLSDVGAYTGAASPYGTYDQNGNVFEWTESPTSLSTVAAVEGGSWAVPRTDRRIWSGDYSLRTENAQLGFRIASSDSGPPGDKMAPSDITGIDVAPQPPVETVLGGGDLTINILAPTVLPATEQVESELRRIDFSPDNVPEEVPGSQLDFAVATAKPGVPFLTYETTFREEGGTELLTINYNIPVYLFDCAACGAPGTPTAAYEFEYGGKPDDHFTWFSLIDGDYHADMLSTVQVTTTITETTTQYFLTLPHPCDFNENGVVDFADFLMFSGVFGQSAEEAGAKFDKDSSGTVDFADFLQFSANFGKEVGAAPVPEPSNVWAPIVLVGCLCLRTKRQRHTRDANSIVDRLPKRYSKS